MIAYMVQTWPGTDEWANEFFGTLAEGRDELKKCADAELPAALFRVEVPDDKAGLIDFLNVKDANHMNLTCEQVARNY